jgi:hypothetical protein
MTRRHAHPETTNLISFPFVPSEKCPVGKPSKRAFRLLKCLLDTNGNILRRNLDREVER